MQLTGKLTLERMIGYLERLLWWNIQRDKPSGSCEVAIVKGRQSDAIVDGEERELIERKVAVLQDKFGDRLKNCP